MKNFMSIGNITQAVNFQDAELTLVLGNNLDLGGDGSRNGVGKTSLLNALSYAFYGLAISNIKRNNLINKTNGKGMLVTVEFSVNEINYRIERGRGPNVLKFYVNDRNAVEETDEGQGEMRLTQLEIERVFGLNHLMFKHLIALNTYNDPFLALRANDQREIIEHLLGITMLSEKALVLKDLLKATKDNIKEEEYRINAVESANDAINKSIKDLIRRQRIWAVNNKDQIANLTIQINALDSFDISAELEAHVALEEYQKKKSDIATTNQLIAGYQKLVTQNTITKESAEEDLRAILNHKCHACGQEMHDDQYDQNLKSKEGIIKKCSTEILDNNENIIVASKLIDEIVLGDMPLTEYSTIQEAYEHKNELSSLTEKLNTQKNMTDTYAEQIKQLENEGIQPIEWDNMNKLHELQEHQDFLLKLLVNKDSFIRKSIITQNLQYLNNRLNYYLTKLGLPHEVIFQSDLTVEITELGRELDFDNLSRGERNRLILGLSWAFRDVHESMNMPIDFLAIDELIDSGLDSNGVEAALGVLKKMNRERNKNIFLISHKEELIGRMNNILYVVKENGFTRFSTDKEFDIDG